MTRSDIKYAIVGFSDVTDRIISQVKQNSADTCRRSVSGDDRAIVSWTGNKPTTLYGVTQYSYDEMRDIVSDESGDWYSDPD